MPPAALPVGDGRAYDERMWGKEDDVSMCGLCNRREGPGTGGNSSALQSDRRIGL